MTAGKIKHLRAETHSNIGEIIERDAAKLIALWADRARDEQPTASRVHHNVLLDHLPIFIAKLGRSLAAAGDDSDEPNREAVEHGEQRWDSGWSITEVVRDYQILRIVIVEYLEKALTRRLETTESLVLNAAIDDAIAASVAAFAASQSAPATAAAITSAGIDPMDLLLNVLGVVGHELRNPLAPLTNSLELLRLVGANAGRVEVIRQMMVRQIKVLGRLVEDMMDLPRLARGKMSIRRERIDLAHLLKACVEDRRGSLEEAGLILKFEAPGEPAWIMGDATRLNQAFGNLIGNAQKFTNSGGTISIRLQIVAGAKAVVTISDTGIGIEPSFLPKIFEAFIQADRSLDRSRGGLGLGLALVKGVVQLHGGSVAGASSGPGTGATFTVELPLTEALEWSTSLAEKTEQSIAGPSQRILVIEDNRDSAESLQMYLELHGHNVLIALSGAEGIAIASDFLPEVVICDVGLPGMDGYAVAATLRGTTPPPRLIIAITGHGARSGSEGGADKAFDYYFIKPIAPERITRLIMASVD